MSSIRGSKTLGAVLMGACLSVAAALAAGACSRSSGPGRAPRESLLEKSRAEVAFQSPAVWRYHPRSEASLLARYETSPNSIVYSGDRGERWLYDKKHEAVHAAARLAPESLIAILRLEDGGWLFVGESGTGYEAREPLGPFVRTSAPVDKLSRVSAAGTSVLGVTRDGQLMQSADAGASWKPVGQKETRFVDVMLADPKNGLALSVPEAAFETHDGGGSWKKIDAPSIGAIGLGWDDKLGVAVQTAMNWMRWDPKATPPFTSLGRAPSKGRFKLPVRPERGPDAGALADGRALVENGEYVEVAAAETPPSSTGGWRASSGERWVLWRGPVAGRLKQKPLDAANGCHALRLAARGRFMYVACSRSAAGANQLFSFLRSEDGGKKFEEDIGNVEGRQAELAMAVGPDGELVVTGICTPQNSARGCLPYGVYHRRKAQLDGGTDAGGDGGKPDAAKPDAGAHGGKKNEIEYELGPSATPALKGSAMALAYSPDGHTVFAVGRRTKGNSLVVFVSHDAGLGFDAREIEQLEGDFSEPTTDDRWARPPAGSVSQLVSVGAAEDGTLAMVLKASGPPTLVVVDEEGRVISLSRAPGEATTMGAVGSRALAFSENTRAAWESLDGGATWDPIGRLPAGGCNPASGSCMLAVRCHLAGCVIGDELSRIGWRGQADDDQGVLSPPDSGSGDLYDRKVRTPISCSLDEKTWQPLEGALQPPTADQSAIGKAAWFSLMQDDKKASASVYHAIGGNKPKVETVQLLAPVPRPNDFAYTANPQVEGAAALRYAAPESGASTSFKNVEVVWDNLLEGKVGRARVADLGPSTPGDYVRVGVGGQHAQPALLSIASGGIYLRIHNSQRDSQPTLFLDGRQTATIPEIPWPGSSPLGVRTEMAHVGSAHVPLMFVGSGVATVRARHEGSSWEFDAFATGLAEPQRSGLVQIKDLAYVQNHAGIQVTSYDPEGTRRMSYLYTFRANGAVVDTPIALPTQLDAGEKPGRCGSKTKADTPRVVVPFQGGTRHPIIVTDSVEPMRVLLTNQAVMYGTREEPCVGSFDAEVVSIDPNVGTPEEERAILLLDDLEHSWLFRSVYGTTGEKHLEYRLMSCHFDPAVEPPPEIFNLPGTKVRRTR